MEEVLSDLKFLIEVTISTKNLKHVYMVDKKFFTVF